MATILPFPSQKAERRKALLIEHSPEAKAELAGVFDQTVWALTYAADNEAAMQLAQAQSFDLILTNAATTCAEDVQMLVGLRAVQPHTRVIILTREWMPGDVLQAIRNHAFSYFTLPIAKEDLRVIVEHAVEEPAWDDGIEMLQGTREHISLAVRCDLATLERLTQFMRESVVLPPVECEEVAFAFREIVMNAMEHGGSFDPQKFVEIGYLRTKRQVLCRVKDPGEGFSMDEIQAAEITGPLADYAEQTHGGKDAELPVCGLGILIARKLVDELVFSERGNEVFLIKYLPQEGSKSR